jgi:hypothetical protein
MSPGTGPFGPIRCPICDTLVERVDYLSHQRSVHPAYTALREKSTRNFARASIIIIAVLVLDILLLRNSWVLPLVVASYAAVIAITLASAIKATRRFKRAWKDQNPEGITSNT